MNKKFVYQVGNNKKVILWCTANRISRSSECANWTASLSTRYTDLLQNTAVLHIQHYERGTYSDKPLQNVHETTRQLRNELSLFPAYCDVKVSEDILCFE